MKAMYVISLLYEIYESYLLMEAILEHGYRMYAFHDV